MIEMLDMFWAYMLVFILAATPFFELVTVIPLAILGGLATIPVTLVALVGNVLTVLLVILLVDKIREWRRRRKGTSEEEKSSKRSLRAQKLWQKYGLPGLAFIGPMLVGSHLTAFMSVTFGGTKKSTANWMTLSLVIWSVVTAILAHLGFDYLYARAGQEGFLFNLFKQR